jgi:hypothetical protein
MQSESTRRSRRFLVAALAALSCSDSGGAPPRASGAPSNLVAASLGGGVHLTWSDNSNDEELFEIEREEGQSGTAFQPLDTVPFGTALYHDASVDLGGRYTYRVRAKLPGNFSAYSNQATVVLDSDEGGGSGGSAGQADTAGSTGKGGSAGKASTGGSPGTGGSGGSAGKAGTGGSPRTGGSGGGAGQVDTAGFAGRSGGAGSGTGGSAGGPTNDDVSFRTDVVPLLVQSCGSTTTGCHNSDQAVGRNKPQYGPCKVIWYSAVDAPLGATVTSGPSQGEPTGCPDLDLYERLMELHSMLCEAPSWEQRARYVVPGDLDNSLIYQVIAGDPSMGGVCTNQGMPVRKMPLVDPEVLPDGVALGEDGIAKIRDWILQGAKNN